MEARELVIVGGGPAGLTAGLYAARARLDAVLIEASLDTEASEMTVSQTLTLKNRTGQAQGRHPAGRIAEPETLQKIIHIGPPQAHLQGLCGHLSFGLDQCQPGGRQRHRTHPELPFGRLQASAPHTAHRQTHRPYRTHHASHLLTFPVPVPVHHCLPLSLLPIRRMPR